MLDKVVSFTFAVIILRYTSVLYYLLIRRLDSRLGDLADFVALATHALGNLKG